MNNRSYVNSIIYLFRKMSIGFFKVFPIFLKQRSVRGVSGQGKLREYYYSLTEKSCFDKEYVDKAHFPCRFLLLLARKVHKTDIFLVQMKDEKARKNAATEIFLAGMAHIWTRKINKQVFSLAFPTKNKQGKLGLLKVSLPLLPKHQGV